MRCELALLENRPEDAARLIVEETWWAGRNGQFNALCVSQFFLARALAAGGSRESALSTARYALDLAEKYGFGRERVRLLAFCGALAEAQGERAAARAHLLRGESLARNMDLRLHRVVLAVALAAHDGKVDWRTWEGLCPERATASHAPAIAARYGFGAFESTVALDAKGTPLGFARLLARLVGGATAVLPREGVFLWWEEGAGLRVHALDPRIARDALLGRLARAARHGATLEELHAARWPGVAWRPERHARGLHALLAQARARIAPSGTRIVARSGRYVLEGDLLALMRPRGEPGNALPSPARTEAILGVLARQGPSSGASVARALGVTRQTLAPVLARLRAAGLITFESKGRHSRYGLP